MGALPQKKRVLLRIHDHYEDASLKVVETGKDLVDPEHRATPNRVWFSDLSIVWTQTAAIDGKVVRKNIHVHDSIVIVELDIPLFLAMPTTLSMHKTTTFLAALGPGWLCSKPKTDA